VSLLSRVADRIYWGARYTERAEDSARVIRAYADLLVDLPSELPLRWEPLVSLTGSNDRFERFRAGRRRDGEPSAELDVIEFLLADRTNPGSIVSTVGFARENLRTTREVLPREAWQALNGLHQYVESEADRAVARRQRGRFLGKVVDESRRLDGVLESTMTRANPYWMWRLGRLVERADMTTRVLGVRAAAILQLGTLDGATDWVDDHDEVQWMGVLRSLSALQMYQRATHTPIEGASVIRFLLFYASFPRSVQGCLDEIRTVLAVLPRPDAVVDALDAVDSHLASCDPAADDGAVLDKAMDELQVRLGDLDEAIRHRYFALG
jgi:uncharacterized alpha-E superfamily protein